MSVRRVFVGGAALALAVVTGCVVEVDFDPSGNDFEIVGSWTINGEAPTAESCAAAGIDRVRLVFFDGGSPYFFDELERPCADGGFATGAIWRWGRYETEWQAVRTDETMTVLFDSRGRMPLVVNSPTTQANVFWDIVATPAFDPTGTDDSLSADWSINGAAPTTATCDDAGIVSVDITLFPEEDADFLTPGVVVASAPCASGKWDSRVDDGAPGAIIRDGRYRTSIDAIGEGGEILQSFRFPEVLDTTAVTHAMLAPADFVTRTTLTVNLGWDTDPSPDMTVAGTCADAGVMMFDYALNDSTGTAIDSGSMVACTEQLMWGMASDLAPGTYSLWIDAKGEGGTTGGWMVTCTDMVVEAGHAEVYNCSVPFVMP